MGEQQQWWWKYNLWENKTFAVDLSQCVAVSAHTDSAMCLFAKEDLA